MASGQRPSQSERCYGNRSAPTMAISTACITPEPGYDLANEATVQCGPLRPRTHHDFGWLLAEADKRLLIVFGGQPEQQPEALAIRVTPQGGEPRKITLPPMGLVCMELAGP